VSLRVVWLAAAWLLSLRFVLTTLLWAHDAQFTILLILTTVLALLALCFPNWRLAGALARAVVTTNGRKIRMAIFFGNTTMGVGFTFCLKPHSCCRRKIGSRVWN